MYNNHLALTFHYSFCAPLSLSVFVFLCFVLFWFFLCISLSSIIFIISDTNLHLQLLPTNST